MLVDDNEWFLRSAASYLAAIKGLKIVGYASSGEEAVARVPELGPDLVMMDIAMKGTNGLEATRLLKEKHPSMRVVIVTMHDTEEYRATALSAKADGFIAKADFGEKIVPLVYRVMA